MTPYKKFIRSSLYRTWSDSKSLYNLFGFPVPILYILLLCTTVFAQLNRYMSTNLAIETGPLESQIVCAATKTIVLLVSLLYFNAPPFPSMHIWGGVVVQLFGSLLYARLSSQAHEKEMRISKTYSSMDDSDSGLESEPVPGPTPARSSSSPPKNPPGSPKKKAELSRSISKTSLAFEGVESL